MALSVKQLVRRHGALVSAVTAASLGLVITVQFLLLTLFDFVTVLPFLGGELYGFGLHRILLIALPFAAGYFLSLWIIAPIAEELRVGHVITRAVLATGIAATVVFIALAVAAIVGGFLPTGVWMPDRWYDFDSVVSGMGLALRTAIDTLVSQLPLGVLGGVLLWLWRKDHPPKHPLAGIIDEV